jgi:hypothetical protein
VTKSSPAPRKAEAARPLRGSSAGSCVGPARCCSSPAHGPVPGRWAGFPSPAPSSAGSRVRRLAVSVQARYLDQSRRGVEQFGQLAGLITRRSQVQILPPLPGNRPFGRFSLFWVPYGCHSSERRHDSRLSQDAGSHDRRLPPPAVAGHSARLVPAPPRQLLRYVSSASICDRVTRSRRASSGIWCRRDCGQPKRRLNGRGC